MEEEPKFNNIFRKMKYIIKNWKKILPFFGIVLFIYIVLRLDLMRLYQVLLTANYKYLLFLSVTIIIIFLLQAIRWKTLLKLQNIKVEFVTLLRIHLISHYYGLITPARVGYLTKISYLQSHLQGFMGEISTSVIIDRILDTLILVLLALTGSLFLLNSYPNIFLYFLVLALILVFAVVFFYSKKRAKFFALFFIKFIPDKYRDRLKVGVNKFYEGLPAIKRLTIPVLLTFAIWFIIYSQTYLVALAMNININYWHFITLLPISTIVGLLPITISGLGTREAALILIFSSYNISSESIVVMSLVALILTSYLPALVGGFLSFKESLQQGKN